MLKPKTGSLKSDIRLVWEGTGEGWLEAPHIYHIENYYYMVAAEGGTGLGHMVTVARASSIWGPYENCPHNPVLTNRNNTVRDLLCTGHGDLFQDHNGAWHMVHLGTRPVRGWNSNLGRETFLSPLVWKDGWPLVGDNGMCKMEFELDEKVEQKRILPWKASFSKEKLDPKWIFLRKPSLDSYFFDGETLTLRPSVTGFTDDASPTFIAVRQPDIECIFEAIFDFVPEEEGDEAGVILYLNSLFHCRIGKKRIDTHDFLIVQRNAEDIKETSFIEKAGSGRLWIRIEADKEYYSFSFSRDGRTYNSMGRASTRLLCVEATGRCFTGMVMGLYAMCSSKTNAVAIFYSVDIKLRI